MRAPALNSFPMETTIPSSTFCATCHCFREGYLEFKTSSGRKYYFSFLCNFCLIPTEGFFILRKHAKKWKPFSGVSIVIDSSAAWSSALTTKWLFTSRHTSLVLLALRSPQQLLTSLQTKPMNALTLLLRLSTFARYMEDWIRLFLFLLYLGLATLWDFLTERLWSQCSTYWYSPSGLSLWSGNISKRNHPSNEVVLFTINNFSFFLFYPPLFNKGWEHSNQECKNS